MGNNPSSGLRMNSKGSKLPVVPRARSIGTPNLWMKGNMNYANMIYTGYIYIPEKEEDFVLGGKTRLKLPPLRADSNWMNDLPEEETQIKQTETSNCTSFAFTNAIEVLLPVIHLADKGINYSDRALGISAETFPPGNSIQKVADTIRNKGLAIERLLPFDDTIKTPKEYYDKSKMTVLVNAMMKEWKNALNFQYEWVYNSSAPLRDKQDGMIEALKFSPVAGSVYAWVEDNGFYVRPSGVQDTHLTCYVGYVPNSHWWVFDSYPPFIKKIPFDTVPQQAMRIEINRKKIERSFWLFDIWKRLIT